MNKESKQAEFRLEIGPRVSAVALMVIAALCALGAAAAWIDGGLAVASPLALVAVVNVALVAFGKWR